ncbi:uncharacterized protein TM35_000083830 [Trypanosoma theileri]|uniref:Uncharacterized protein n=1 Tax=Trypanosoma theileri TaxID=67003 RepID=A0A1X0P113_9TRYP|nr:uncharacterized protein TM35_000083830 [Trypanosoma theileri]ORC90585.1 hypothetical protein TM35_000083830 [Trypanosoma theileri]
MNSQPTKAVSGWAADEAYLVGPNTTDGRSTLNTTAVLGEDREYMDNSNAATVGTSIVSMNSHLPYLSSFISEGQGITTTALDNNNINRREIPQQQQQPNEKKVENPQLIMLNEQSKLECLASIAYLVGSPLQRFQPTAVEPVQRSLGIVRELLRRGMNPEQIVRIIETREGTGGI